MTAPTSPHLTARAMLAALLILSVIVRTGPVEGAPPMAFTLGSPAFSAGGGIPARYTCEGEDISPPLVWSAPPPATKSLALIVDDPDAPDPARAPKNDLGPLGALQPSPDCRLVAGGDD
jgi:phosphatidylethanolamine-binding protein (PEBP) family uncharacterized protein